MMYYNIKNQVITLCTPVTPDPRRWNDLTIREDISIEFQANIIMESRYPGMAATIDTATLKRYE